MGQISVDLTVLNQLVLAVEVLFVFYFLSMAVVVMVKLKLVVVGGQLLVNKLCTAKTLEFLSNELRIVHF